MRTATTAVSKAILSLRPQDLHHLPFIMRVFVVVVPFIWIPLHLTDKYSSLSLQCRRKTTLGLTILNHFRLGRTGATTPSVAQVDFVIDLGRHATGHAAKDGVGEAPRDAGGNVNGVAIREASDNVAAAGQNLQAVGAPNETDIILIQFQLVLLTNHHGRRRYGQTWTAARFQTHAGYGALFVTALAGLQTATTPKISLTTLIIGPSGSRIDMIQRLVTDVHLGTTVTEHGSQTTTATLVTAPHLAERHVKGFAATVVLAHGLDAGTFLLIGAERFVGEAE
mmetsp:Transcript_25530/g.70512  ORF Transcript_25530/g.70512 Transcript_25530/m.70512 type:complete len:281 (-) Transcript_25530:112-954(-)